MQERYQHWLPCKEETLARETYGVMGMLERMREPSSPPGVAPGAALRDEGDALSSDLDDGDFSASSRRNCSLFMAAMFVLRNRVGRRQF